MTSLNLFCCYFAIIHYPNEYMNDWEKFNETSLSEKKNFYSHLIMEDNTDEDYAHTKRVCKDFEIANLS